MKLRSQFIRAVAQHLAKGAPRTEEEAWETVTREVKITFFGSLRVEASKVWCDDTYLYASELKIQGRFTSFEAKPYVAELDMEDYL